MSAAELDAFEIEPDGDAIVLPIQRFQHVLDALERCLRVLEQVDFDAPTDIEAASILATDRALARDQARAALRAAGRTA